MGAFLLSLPDWALAILVFVISAPIGWLAGKLVMKSIDNRIEKKLPEPAGTLFIITSHSADSIECYMEIADRESLVKAAEEGYAVLSVKHSVVE